MERMFENLVVDSNNQKLQDIEREKINKVKDQQKHFK
jgi:hypothetical protein